MRHFIMPSVQDRDQVMRADYMIGHRHNRSMFATKIDAPVGAVQGHYEGNYGHVHDSYIGQRGKIHLVSWRSLFQNLKFRREI